MLVKRLRLKDWHGSGIRKLDTMEELYTMASDRSDARQGNLLELLIVVLIAIEIVLLVVGVA